MIQMKFAKSLAALALAACIPAMAMAHHASHVAAAPLLSARAASVSEATVENTSVKPVALAHSAKHKRHGKSHHKAHARVSHKSHGRAKHKRVA